MKLLRARIQNFRLLGDLDFEFSTDRNRNLTVVRAENESGKTTLLTALQWGLFGDIALPGGRNDYRLSSLDYSENGANNTVDVSVEIDFELPSRTDNREYRLITHATETVVGTSWTCKVPVK